MPETTTTHPRHPVGIADRAGRRLYVVCDDGSVWVLDPMHGGWMEAEPIPGTPAAEAETTGKAVAA